MRIVGEARGMIDRGHRVLIAARPQCAILVHAAAAGIETAAVRMRRNLDPAAIASVRALIRRERVDLVNTHSSIDAWVGGLAATLARVPLVRTRHVSKRIRRHPLNFVHSLATATITTGEALRQQFVEDTDIDPARVVSIPTGIDLDHFAPDPDRRTLRSRLGLTADAKIVATIAVLRQAKRHTRLLEAAAALRERNDLFFVFAGEGSQRAPIEQRIMELGLGERVRLLGHVEDVRPVLAGADVIASASSGMEGVPQALLQALAMERPVVATDDGAVAEIIRDQETGLLVPREQPRALADALEKMLDQPAFAGACGRRGRELVARRYSRAAMLDALEALYGTILP